MNFDVYCDESHPDAFTSKNPRGDFLVIGSLWLAERAERILEGMEERRVTTTEARESLEKLAAEKIAMQRARETSKLSTNAFTLFWHLQQEKLAERESLARDIDVLIARFPNRAANVYEYRQLKGELLKKLLRYVDGARLIKLADQLLALPRE